MADLLKRLKISEQQYGVGMEDNPFQDVSNDEAMKVCFGGGGGGQPPPPPPQTVTQQTSNIPEYFQPYLERLFERAEGVTTEPFQRYEGQRLAEFTPEQQAAYSGVGELVGDYKPYIASADLLTAQAAQQSTDPTAIAARMNPYQQAVIDIQKREALRDAEKLQQQIGAQAVGAGAFGGSRQALVESELARQQGQRLADIQAVGSQQAYDKAMEQLAADRAASLAAGQQFATLGGQQQQLGLAGLGALETVGGTRQAQQQKALDIAYEDFARETTRPSQQVQEMSSVLRGFNLPVSTYTTAQQQTQQPGLGQQLLGAGLGVYGLGSQFGLFKEGGIVNKFGGGKILEGSTRYDPNVNPSDFSRPYVSSIYKFVSDPRNPRNPFSGQRTFTNPYDKKDRTRYDVKKGEIPSFIEGRDRMLFEKGLKEVGYAEDQEPGGVPDVAGASDLEKERLDRDYLLSTRQILADRPEVVENLGEFDTTLSEPSDILTAGDRGPMPYMETKRRVEDGEVIGPGEQPKSVADQTQPGGSPVGDLSGLAPFLNTDIKDILTAKPEQQAAPEDVGPKGSTNIENKLNAIIAGYDKSKTEGDEREKKGLGRLPGDLIASIGLNLMTGDPDVGPAILTQAASATKKVLPEATRRREREEDREQKAAERKEDVALKALGIQTDLEKVKLQEAGKGARLDKELGYKYDVFGAEIGLKKKDLDSQIKVREANIVEMGRRGNLSEMEVINRLVNDKETLALTKEKFEFNKGLKNQELSLAERKQLFDEDQAIVDTNLRRAKLLAEQGATSAAEKRNVIDVLKITQDAINEMQKELSNPLLQGSKDIINQQIKNYQFEVNNLKQMLGVGVSTTGGQTGAGANFGYGSVKQLGP